MKICPLSRVQSKEPEFVPRIILGDPGADSGGEGNSKRATKKKKTGEDNKIFSSPVCFVARLDFPSPLLSAPGSPRMTQNPSVKLYYSCIIFQVIKLLVVIAAVYAVFTLPYHVTWLFSVFGYPNSVAKKLCLLVIATSAAHLIIYGTLNQEFGRGFKAFFRCMKEQQWYRAKQGRTDRVSGMSSHVTWRKTQRT